MRSYDPNMETALIWANEIGPPPNLPDSLKNIETRAKLGDDMDGPFIQSSLLANLSDSEKRNRLDIVADISKRFIVEVKDDNIRVNVSLRLWSGCISAAKTIALETRSGPNFPQLRFNIFSKHIDPISIKDPIYRAGVEAAPIFKN